MKKVSVIVTDDHQLVAKGIVNIILSQSDLQLIGEAQNGQELIGIINQKLPDVVLLDIDMPVMNGLEALTFLKKNHPKIKIIMLSMHNEKSVIEKTIELGANGFISKNTSSEDLITAIHSVIKGNSYFSKDIKLSLIKKQINSTKLITSQDVIKSKLTQRELDVFQCKAEGLSNQETAKRLNIGIRTVETHRKNIMDKLQISNASALIKLAFQAGFIK